MSAYESILVAVDGSAPSTKGLAEALRLAKAEGATLHLVHIVDELLPVATAGYAAEDILKSMANAGKDILAAALKAARDAGVPAESSLIECVGGRAASFIVDEAARSRADLIVLGTHGRRGFRRFVMGSDAEEVVRTSPVPVLLVRGPESP